MIKFQRMKEIKGDASLRKFFRKKSKNSSSIVVFSCKEKFKNLLVYDSINKILIKNNILAPKLYTENYEKNYIEIQDLGNETIYQVLVRKKKNHFSYFKKIIDTLKKIQLIKNRKIKNFKNNKYSIPIYKKKILFKEANLFCEWFILKNLPKSKKKQFKRKFRLLVKKILSKLKLKNNVFVHRDFHVSNLILKNNRIGVIDSQDALIGSKAYDLASLIDDVRFKTSKSFKNLIYEYYLKSENKIDKEQLKNDFEILSVLRNLKIIGIFTRLSIRDKKKKYLKLIPYAWRLISLRIGENKNLEPLRELLIKNFKNRIK